MILGDQRKKKEDADEALRVSLVKFVSDLRPETVLQLQYNLLQSFSQGIEVVARLDNTQ